MPRKASISPKWNVPDLFRQRLGDVAGRQRAMAADGHLLLILHELPTEHSAQRNLRLFWRAPDGTWQSDCLGGGIVALQTHLTEYSTGVDQLERLEDQATGSDDYFRIRHAISPIRRASHNLHGAAFGRAMFVLFVGIAMGLVVKALVVPKLPRVEKDRYAVSPRAK